MKGSTKISIALLITGFSWLTIQTFFIERVWGDPDGWLFAFIWVCFIYFLFDCIATIEEEIVIGPISLISRHWKDIIAFLDKHFS